MSRSLFEPAVTAPPTPGEGALLLLVRSMDVVTVAEAAGLRFPTRIEAESLADGMHLLGRLRGVECYAAPLKDDATLPSGWSVTPARALFGRVDEDLFGVAGRALAVAEWDRNHRFCGKCGQRTELSPTERARRCPACRTPFYPRLAPAVIVLIHRGDEVLLARGADFPKPWFSTLAGFVEPGESLEEAVAREVREEVGVELTDIRYFGSQPWPFGRSLMIGFNATYAGGELRPDPTEIAEARWFRRDALPETPPRLSIARQLIDAWIASGSP